MITSRNKVFKSMRERGWDLEGNTNEDYKEFLIIARDKLNTIFDKLDDDTCTIEDVQEEFEHIGFALDILNCLLEE